MKPSLEKWSDSSKTEGFLLEEARVDVTISETETQVDTSARKERPVWMVESTVITEDAQVMFNYSNLV